MGSNKIRDRKGRFVKGNIPWNKGISPSKETREKLSKSLTGRKLSEKTKRKMSTSLIGNKRALGYKLTEEHKIKISNANIGKRNLYCVGKNNPNWKGGTTPLRIIIRTHSKYNRWRLNVFTRDNFICQECRLKGVYLEAHHIKEFAKILEKYKITTLKESLNCEELWDINNGKTLCLNCHNLTKTNVTKK